MVMFKNMLKDIIWKDDIRMFVGEVHFNFYNVKGYYKIITPDRKTEKGVEKAIHELKVLFSRGDEQK